MDTKIITYKNFKICNLQKFMKFHDLQKFQNFMTYKNLITYKNFEIL